MSRLHLHKLSHTESHFASRIGWLRAAVLGANDGIVSTASLIVGVAAATSDSQQILLAGVAGMVAGAMSMAAGEYVSVSSQSDTEKADLAREAKELIDTPEEELNELTQIYVTRGLDYDLARQVAVKFTETDALAVHAREELGITDFGAAQPVQAAFTSAVTFTVGAALPLLSVLFFAPQNLIIGISIVSLFTLALLGAVGAKVGGANILKAALRVTFWGAFAMALTSAIGAFFGTKIL